MILKYKKTFIYFTLACFLFFPPRKSDAIFPVIAIWALAAVGESILLADLIVGITGTLSAVLWYECNGLTLSPICTNKPASMPASSAPPAPLTVNLKPDGVRTNPDPTKFDSPAPSSGKRDVTPKAAFKSKLPAVPAQAGTPAPPVTPPPTMVDTVSYFDPNASSINTADAARWRYEKSHANDDARIVTQTYVNEGMPGKLTSSTVVYQAVTVVLSVPVSQFGQISQADQNAIKNARDAAAAALRADFPSAWDPAFNPVAIGIPLQVGDTVSRQGVGLQFPVQYVNYSCDAGYSVSGDQCVLTNVENVKKPANTPCELLYDANTKQILSDPANPNCTGRATINGSNVSAKSSGDGSTLDINPNAAGGFDIKKGSGDGSSVTVSTGSYDGVGKGYPITGSKSGNGTDPNGSSCGIAGYPPCEISISSNAESDAANGQSQSDIKDGEGKLKSLLAGLNKDMFRWSFIPNIPTASCRDPTLQNPLGTSMVTMPICGAFNALSFFINCVLAVLCIYGCKQQVNAALKA